MNQVYLAEIHNSRFGLRRELLLLACKRSDSTWILQNSKKSICFPSQYNHFASLVLVVAIVNSKQVCIKVELARDEILQSFKQWSSTKLKIEADLAKNEAWHQSLTYQSAELAHRSEVIAAEKELLNSQKIKVQELMKTVEEKKSALKQEKDALAVMWKRFDRNGGAVVDK